MVHDKAILTMADKYEVRYDLSIGAIFSDIIRPPNQISSSCQYSTLNNGKRLIDTYLVLQKATIDS